MNDGQLLLNLTGHEKQVNCVAFSHTGNRLASGSDDGTVKLWSTIDGQRLQNIQAHEAGVLSVAFDSTDKLLASGGCGSYQTAKLWSCVDGKLHCSLPGEKDWG
jgi:WD40 repeat protein